MWAKLLGVEKRILDALHRLLGWVRLRHLHPRLVREFALQEPESEQIHRGVEQNGRGHRRESHQHLLWWSLSCYLSLRGDGSSVAGETQPRVVRRDQAQVMLCGVCTRLQQYNRSLLLGYLSQQEKCLESPSVSLLSKSK